MDKDIMQGLLPEPTSITVIATYQCTAACRDCCFESSPALRGRLAAGDILDFINESKRSFTGLQVVVFSGGEPLLMGNALLEGISAARRLGLKTRVVTNGYWGKTERLAGMTACRLAEAGLSEINISTGLDHAEFVPLDAVVNAIKALSHCGIPNRVTIEADHAEGTYAQELMNHPVVADIREKAPELLSFQVNTWMPFHRDSAPRPLPSRAIVDAPCQQIFKNLVLTPHGQVSACCGLTFEHIRELKLGRYAAGSLLETYKSQFDDFLKIWIAVEGPVKIVERVMGREASTFGDSVHHMCQACAILHQDPCVRTRLEDSYSDYVPEVVSRFMAANALAAMEQQTGREVA